MKKNNNKELNLLTLESPWTCILGVGFLIFWGLQLVGAQGKKNAERKRREEARRKKAFLPIFFRAFFVLHPS